MTLAEQFINIKKYGYVLDNKTDANGMEHSMAEQTYTVEMEAVRAQVL
jgi:hypothetical protein